MKKQATIMGMPVTVQIVDSNATDEDIQDVFAYLHYIDQKFSTYKKDSEISQINRGEVKHLDYSNEMQKVLASCEETKQLTDGYFDINLNGILDPSGIVKGYAIWQAAQILKKKGYANFYVEIAGDIQVFGKNEDGESWKVGIQNPFNLKEIIKIVRLSNKGIATSGNYQRGKHILNPKTKLAADEIAGISVIGPNVYEADRFATAAFAMGEEGIKFIGRIKGFAGYMVRNDRTAVMTGGFAKYTL
jgi:thiamine biosynthesis lipoprotein